MLRSWLEAIPTATWLLIGALAILVLWVATTLPKMRAEDADSTHQAENVPAVALPIGDAVTPSSGGSGLASAAFAPRLPWLGIGGWLHIKEPGKECLVIDARHVVQDTRVYLSPMRLLGRPLTARRVLLSPAPLNDVSAKELTSDRLPLTLLVSVKYEVADPVYVASLQAPLSELTNLITGKVAEYIRSDTLENIVRDDGSLRQRLRQQIEMSPTISGTYNIIEVLKALPTGDERIIEIIRQTREALQSSALIEQEGRNRALAANYDLAIEKAEAELTDEFEQRQHIREMAMVHLQRRFDVQTELVRTIAAVAAAGGDATSAIREIQALVLQPAQELPAALSVGVIAAENLISVERRSLDRIQAILGITQFDIQPHLDDPAKPGSARVEFDGFTVLIECAHDYPEQSPTVRLRLGQGDAALVAVPWREGSNLVDAITAAAMQAHASMDDHT